MKYILLFFTYLFLETSFVSATTNMVDCSVIVGGNRICNPYASQLINVNNVQYEKDTKKLIINKTLVVPQKPSIKVITVEDIIEKYVKVEDSLRFKSPLHRDLDTKIRKKNLSSIPKKHKKIVQPSKKITITKVVRHYGKYEVSTHDTFNSIATKFYTTTKELFRINIIDKKRRLKKGDKVRIPLAQDIINAIVSGTYCIKSGDTLLSIAQKFKISSKEIIELNQIESNSMIKVGQKLKLSFHTSKKQKSVVVKKVQQIKTYVKKIKMIRPLNKRKLRVTATAYSSHAQQTDKTPFLAAWNNRLKPGMKIIAVSRDLLTRYGMKNGTRVRIAGLSGYYQVRDKMNKRYSKRIDIYMGINRRRALQWGRRSVVIYW